MHRVHRAVNRNQVKVGGQQTRWAGTYHKRPCNRRTRWVRTFFRMACLFIVLYSSKLRCFVEQHAIVCVFLVLVTIIFSILCSVATVSLCLLNILRLFLFTASQSMLRYWRDVTWTIGTIRDDDVRRLHRQRSSLVARIIIKTKDIAIARTLSSI